MIHYLRSWKSLFAALTISAGPAGAQSFEGLGTLGPRSTTDTYEVSRAFDVSADGSTVVGYTTKTGSQQFHAFIWKPDTGMRAIDQDGFLYQSQARGVSADGQTVVLWVAENINYQAFAYLWTDSGGLQRISDEGQKAYPRALSADGRVAVGYGQSPSGHEAFRWTATNGFQWLGDLPGSPFTSDAHDVSGDGSVIIGYGTLPWPVGGRPVLWSDGVGPEIFALPSESNAGGHLAAISADGAVIAGLYNVSPGPGSATTGRTFRWTASTGFTVLGSTVDGSGWSPYGISDDGSLIVGQKGFSEALGCNGGAAMWTSEHGTRFIRDVLTQDYDLNLDGWELCYAFAVSGDGRVIVGYGVNPQGREEAWRATLSTLSNDLIVNVTSDEADADPDDGVIDIDLSTEGLQISLRAAIDAVNDGIDSSIKFDIPGTGIPAISLTGALPAITKPVKIDGTTQSAKWVEINGGGMEMIGLDVLGGDSEIRGLVMNGFIGNDGVCIQLRDGDNNKIVGNYLGTDSTGSAAVQTNKGINILSDANTIGGEAPEDGNIIGSELGIGIRGSDNKIFGNRIGVGLDGHLLPDVIVGIGIVSGSGNQIGGSGATGNFIACKTWEIFTALAASIDGLAIRGNRIGLDEDGRVAHTGRGGSVGLRNEGTFTISNLTIENNKIAGGSPEIWLANGVTGAKIINNQIGLAFDDSGQLPTTVGENNKDQGIRLDNAPDTLISGNVVVGHEFNVLISGQNQWEETEEDEIQFYQPGFELDPEPAGDPSANVVIDNNSIGLVDNVKPNGVDQEVGIAVFGKARTTTISNNTVAGHSDDELWLKDGEGYNVIGNRIGTPDGTDFGSQDGIVVTDANQVTIGSGDAEGRNIISRNAGIGIDVKGKADGTRILNNHIGTNSGATEIWPNGAGVAVQENNSDDQPENTEIRDNVIGGSQFEGIFVGTPNPTAIEDNFIGRSRSGIQLPNKIGVRIDDAPTRLFRNTIAHSTETGIKIAGDQPVSIESNPIFENGDGSSKDGIHYETPPFDPPVAVAAFRTPPDGDGNVIFWLSVLVSDETGNPVVEVFGSPRESDPQGRVPLFREAIKPGEVAFGERFDVPASHSYATQKSFSATVTRGDSTSEFSTTGVLLDFKIPPVFKVIPAESGGFIIGWYPPGLFRLEEASSVGGPWAESINDLEKIEEEGIELEVAKVLVSPRQDRFFRLNIDWDKVLSGISQESQ